LVAKKLQQQLVVMVVLFTAPVVQAELFQVLPQAEIGTVQVVVQAIPVTTAVVHTVTIAAHANISVLVHVAVTV
jgi:hypothetical protein